MITKPAEYEVPDQKGPGDTFEELVTLRIEEDGYLTPIAIAGVDIPEEVAEDEAVQPEQSIGQSIMEGMV